MRILNTKSRIRIFGLSRLDSQFAFRLLPFDFAILNSRSEFRVCSDNIRKATFGLAEVPDAADNDECHCDGGESEARPVNGVLTAENGPPKAVNDAHHGIERVEKAPLFRYDAAGETDW